MATADRTTEHDAPPLGYRTCDATTRAGGRCQRPAGWGTTHPTWGNCKLHGGASPSGATYAAKLEAQATARSVADESDLDPHDALLWCVRRAAGELAFFTAKARDVDDEQLLVDHTRTRRSAGDGASFVERTSQAELHPWVRLAQEAMDRLARFSKMAIDAGVAERHVRVAERFGQVIGTLLERVLADLRLTDEQLLRAPAIVRQHLTLLEGGAETKAA